MKTKATDIYISRKRCAFEKLEKDELFFSLMDYRNSLFTSNDPKKIIEFYDGFENRDELIEWMKERPKGASYIREVEGDKDIIVVIPTADFNGKYARECRDNIFKGLHMIFVESGEIPDPYFNGAHNVNIGIKKAMEYNPKWIVFSNDDMYKIDDVNILIKQLKNLNSKEIACVFTQPSLYHSVPERISERNLFYYILYFITNKDMGRNQLRLYRKFEIKFLMSPLTGRFSKLFKRGYTYLESQSFAIYSFNLVKLVDGNVYDDIFISAAEDTDLSLRLSLHPERTAKIDYKIGEYVGSTLGVGVNRGLRSIAGLSYLNYKWYREIESLILDPGDSCEI